MAAFIKNTLYGIYIKLFPNRNKITTVKKSKIKKRIFICLMLAYPVLHFLIFWLYVNFNSILLAFKDINTQEYTLYNFQKLFTDLANPENISRYSIFNTIWFFITGNFIGLPLSLVFSYFMFKKVYLSKFFRVVFFLPSIISAVVLTTLYGYLLKSNGPVNLMLSYINISPVEFLTSEGTILKSILFYTIWSGLGFNIILISGAISRIPVDIFECCRLEGVGFFREFTKIVIPLIFPTISSIFILGTVGMFTVLGPVLLLSSDTFMRQTSTMAFFIYYCVKAENLEYASAAGLIYTLIGMPIILTVRYIMNKINEGIEF